MIDSTIHYAGTDLHMKPTRICLIGATGRMGHAILSELDERFELVSVVASPRDPFLGRSLSELGFRGHDIILTSSDELGSVVRDVDVAISFTTPEAEVENLPVIAQSGVRCVVGTTGLDGHHHDVIKSMARSCAVMVSSNYSIGIALMRRMISSLHNLPPEFDTSIIDVHHSSKRDAPSGTAKQLAEDLAQITGKQPVVQSLRVGGVTGIHEVQFTGRRELLKIEHIAFDRSVFARGALLAAQWISNKKPGLYAFEDALSDSLEPRMGG